MTVQKSTFSPLFRKFIEQPRQQSEVEPVESETLEGMVQSIHGFYIPQSEAMMVVKKGKVVGWDRF